MRYRLGIILGFILLSGLLWSVFPGTAPEELEAQLPGSSGTERIQLLLKLTEIYLDKVPKKALAYSEEASILLHSLSDPGKQMIVLNYMSKAKALLGDFQAAEDYALQSQSIAQSLDDKNGEAEAIISISDAYLYRGNYLQARQYCLEAKKRFEDTGNRKGAATTLRMLGTIYWRMGDFPRALDFALKADGMYKTIDDRKGSAALDMLISRLYSTQGDYKKAQEYNFKAKQNYEELGNKVDLARVINNIGNDYRRSGDYEEALKYLKQVSTILLEMDLKQLYSYSLNNIGEVLAESSKFKQAQNYFSQSLRIKEEIKDQMGIAYTLINIGKTYRSQGRYQEATKTLLRALAIAKEINIKTEIKNAHKELSDTFESLQDYPKALYYYKKYKEYNDSIFNEENSKKITELEAGYESEKKEKEIALLKKDKEIQQLELIKQKNLKNFLVMTIILILLLAFLTFTRFRLKIKTARALQKEIEDRKKVEAELVKSEKLEAVGILAGGIAHDFNNLLTVIIGNLTLAEDEIQHNPKLSAKSLKAAEKASLQASELSQKLITFSKGGWIIPQKISFPTLLRSTIEYYPELSPLVRNLSISTDLKPIYGDERQLRQVIYNILKNADEAMKDPKEVTIRGENIYINDSNNFSLTEGHYVKISFIDTGCGIPQNQLGKVFLPYFSTKEDVTQKGRGLGLSICYSITRKHNGQIYVFSEPDIGTTVELYLPAHLENVSTME